ncbi:hypothetical protein [Streptomyces yangpuensis]|uniref:hypothetical protein n=1 Tax=Streptomyces yangpuensis TaxID=1648182 RepID=UPI0037198328
MSDWDAQAVRARLRAKTLRYELRPPLRETAVRAFEAEHGIRLPEECRTFVTTVGDGPAGPGYGLMPLIAPRPEADDDWAVDDDFGCHLPESPYFRTWYTDWLEQ